MAKLDLKKIQGYLSAEKMKDLDRFLDALPGNVGYNALIFAFSTWALAAAAVLFAVMATKDLTELRTKLLEVEALQPPVPEITYTPVSKSNLQKVVDGIEGLYPGVSYIIDGNGEVSVSAGDVRYIPQFKSAISHLQNGGKMWRTQIKDLCFGKECSGPKLQGTLSFYMVRVEDAKIEQKEN